MINYNINLIKTLIIFIFYKKKTFVYILIIKI
jgi:hypothetical protein